MATTTATITLTSGDMMDNNISISNTATLTNQGNDTGMTKTTGLTRIITAAQDNVVLINTGDASDLGADNTVNKGKIFIQNLNARGDGSKYVTVLMQAVEIGRLYGGDWCFFPFDGAAAGDDVELTPSSATETTIEYIAFYE